MIAMSERTFARLRHLAHPQFLVAAELKQRDFGVGAKTTPGLKNILAMYVCYMAHILHESQNRPAERRRALVSRAARPLVAGGSGFSQPTAEPLHTTPLPHLRDRRATCQLRPLWSPPGPPLCLLCSRSFGAGSSQGLRERPTTPRIAL